MSSVNTPTPLSALIGQPPASGRSEAASSRGRCVVSGQLVLAPLARRRVSSKRLAAAMRSLAPAASACCYTWTAASREPREPLLCFSAASYAFGASERWRLQQGQPALNHGCQLGTARRPAPIQHGCHITEAKGQISCFLSKY